MGQPERPVPDERTLVVFPRFGITRRLRCTPLIALYALATLLLLGGSLLLPPADSGRATAAAPATPPASQPPQPTPTVYTSPSPTPAPASEPPAAPQPAAMELAAVEPAETAPPEPTPPPRPTAAPSPTQRAKASPTPRPTPPAPRPAAPAPAAPGGARAYALAQVGSAQFACLSPLWERESGWNAYAVNSSSGAYGIPQALGHGHPYALGDYRAQIDWGLNYIRNRYGSPCGAWSFWQSHRWY